MLNEIIQVFIASTVSRPYSVRHGSATRRILTQIKQVLLDGRLRIGTPLIAEVGISVCHAESLHVEADG